MRRWWIRTGAVLVVALGLVVTLAIPQGALAQGPVLADVVQANGLYFPGSLQGARAYIETPDMPYPPAPTPKEWTRMRVAVGNEYSGDFASFGWYRQSQVGGPSPFYVASESRVAQLGVNQFVAYGTTLNVGSLYFYEMKQTSYGSTTWLFRWGPNGGNIIDFDYQYGPGGSGGTKGLCGGGANKDGVEIGPAVCFSNQHWQSGVLAYTGASFGVSPGYWGYTLSPPFAYYDWKVGGKCGAICHPPY